MYHILDYICLNFEMYLSLILPSLIIFRSCDRSVRSWEVPLTVADNWLNVLNKGVTCSLGSRRRELLEKLRWNPGQSADKRIKIISAPGQNNIQIVTHTLQWFNLIFPSSAVCQTSAQIHKVEIGIVCYRSIWNALIFAGCFYIDEEKSHLWNIL